MRGGGHCWEEAHEDERVGVRPRGTLREDDKAGAQRVDSQLSLSARRRSGCVVTRSRAG